MTRLDLVLWILDAADPADAARMRERIDASPLLRRRVAALRDELAGARGSLEPSGWRVRSGAAPPGLALRFEATFFGPPRARPGQRLSLVLRAETLPEDPVIVLLHRAPGSAWALHVPRRLSHVMAFADLRVRDDGSRVLDVVLPAQRGEHSFAVFLAPRSLLSAAPPERWPAVLQAFAGDAPIAVITVDVS